MNKYKLTTLKNGLRVITVPTKNSEVVSVAISVSAGADYESKKESGISHFLEHMFFKGTETRDVKDIRDEIKEMGARHNAYTSSFNTHYYIDSHVKFFSKSLDILSDLFLNSIFPEKEIEKERGVILSEIDRSMDNPPAQSFYNLINLMYGDQPAGRKVLGSKENIRRFNRDDFIKYRDKHYNLSQTTLTIVGDIKHNEVIKKVNEKFGNAKTHRGKTFPPKIKESQRRPEISILNKKTEQTHISVGIRTFSRFDKREPVLTLLNTILGGTSASRLFSILREEMGLAYSVISKTYLGHDYGSIIIYMGVDHNRAEEAVKALMDLIKVFKKDGVTDEEIRKFKAYLLGVQALAYETTGDLADFYGNQLALMYKHINTPKEIYEKEKKVNKKDIDKLAKEIFQNKNINLSIVGPHSKAKFEKIFKL